MKVRSVLFVGAVGGTLLLTGCSNGNPCAELGAPTPEDIIVASNGREVEVPRQGNYSEVECIVDPVTGTWSDEGPDD